MLSLEFCSETEVAEMVTTFYGKVRSDAILAPIFERHVADWSVHMPKLSAYWVTAQPEAVKARASVARRQLDRHGTGVLE